MKILHNTPFALTPEWHIFYWQFIGLLILMLPLKAAMLLPSLRHMRGWLQLAVKALGILILVIMVQVRIFFVSGSNVTAESLHSLQGINNGITFGFKVALAISAIKFVWDLWQEISTGQHRRAHYAAVL
jgi:hypothetical protein